MIYYYIKTSLDIQLVFNNTIVYYYKETNLETLISNISYWFIKDNIRNLAYMTGFSKLVSL